MLLSFDPQQKEKLRQLLNAGPQMVTPFRQQHGGSGRAPVLVRCTSATAAGGAGVAAQCYPAVVLNINSLVTTQEETAAVWLTLLDGSGTGTPIEGEAYYGLYAGSFDPGSDPRPRVFVTAGGSGGSAGGGQCALASLREIDCIKLNDGDDDVWLVFATSTWTGTNDRGAWVFGWDATVGISYLTLDGTRLMNCGNGCFTGGALTGHIAQEGNGTADECTGESFTVCLSCACCPFEGYDGPGWYCLEVDAVCTPVEILGDGDECEAWVWCSGPYATEAEAQVVCGTCEAALSGLPSSSMLATFSNKTGGASCLPDTLQSAGAGTTEWTWGPTWASCTGGNDTIKVSCVSGDWTFTCFDSTSTALGDCTGLFGFTVTVVSYTAYPSFELVVDFSIAGSGFIWGSGGGGSFRMTITVVP